MSKLTVKFRIMFVKVYHILRNLELRKDVEKKPTLLLSIHSVSRRNGRSVGPVEEARWSHPLLAAEERMMMPAFFRPLNFTRKRSLVHRESAAASVMAATVSARQTVVRQDG